MAASGVRPGLLIRWSAVRIRPGEPFTFRSGKTPGHPSLGEVVRTLRSRINATTAQKFAKKADRVSDDFSAVNIQARLPATSSTNPCNK